MNIYEKLQNARVKLLEQGLKKGGQNQFIKFNYFELSDFLPELQKILKEFKLSTHFEMRDGIAVLKIIDYEKDKDNVIEFSCPLVMAENKQSQNIQNLGATITYLRRYLYLIAFEVTESDQVDCQPAQLVQAQNKESDIDYLKKEFIEKFRQKDLSNISRERLEKLDNLKIDIIDNKFVDKIRLNNALLFLNTLNDKGKINFFEQEVKND